MLLAPAQPVNVGSTEPAEWPSVVDVYGLGKDALLALADRMQVDQAGLTEELVAAVDLCLSRYQPAPPPPPPRPAAPALPPVPLVPLAAAPAPPPPTTPLPFEPITVPPDRSDDPEPVKRAKGSLRYQIDRLQKRVRLEARLGSPDPMQAALYNMEAHNAPLARYLIAVRAGRADLAADFLAEAAAEFRTQPAVFDEILGDLVTPELKAAAAPPPPPPPPAPAPAPTPAPAPAATSAAPCAPAPHAGNPITRVGTWDIPLTEVDAWAISVGAAAEIITRADADLTKARADGGARWAELWRLRWRAGEAVAFFNCDQKVPGILNARKRDDEDGIRTKVPAHLREQVRARKAEMRAQWEADRQARWESRKKQRAGGGKGKRTNRVVEKLLQEKEFRQKAGTEYGLDALAQIVWSHLWDGEKNGTTATTERVLAERLGGVHRNTVRARVELLMEKKFLRRVRKGERGKSSTVFDITHRPNYWPKQQLSAE